MADYDARRGGGRPSSGGRGRQGGGSRQGGLRRFTEGMRAMSDAAPWNARGHRDQRGGQGSRTQGAGRQADRRGLQDDTSPSVAMAQAGDSWEADRAFWSQAIPAKATTRPAGRKVPQALVAVLIVLSLVVGFCATQGVMRAIDLLAAALDAQAQVTTLEGIAKSGQYFSADSMGTIQNSLHSLDDDVLRVQADMPVGEFGAKGAEVTHAFQMATDLIRAGEYGVDAGQTMIPALKDIMGGLSPATASTSTKPTLTEKDLERVNYDVSTAAFLAQAAESERAQIKDSDLDALHLGKVASILDKMDSITPKIPKYVDLAKLGLVALAPLLGISPNPTAHYLLFDQDSDELRPSGGFLGNFAVLTMHGGQLVGGLHLQNVYKYDCPGPGELFYSCRDVQVPSSPTNYTWMNAGDDSYFGMRDSNLEPDFPISASYIEQNYTQEWQYFPELQSDYPKTIDGVFAFTPQFIGKIIDVLGGVTVPGFNVRVTSANLQDYIHYFHVLYEYCNNVAFGPNDPKTCRVILGSSDNATNQKAFDATIGTVVMHAAASAPPSVQGKIIKAALDSLRTRDLQLYFNNPQIESLLTKLQLDDALPAIHGDQTMVEDVNVGATYANADVQEHINDTVTLNTDGSASHDMVVTYSYPWRPHLYSQQGTNGESIYLITQLSYNYAAVARVLVPGTMNEDAYPACGGDYHDWKAESYPDTSRSVMACKVDVSCNACGSDGKNNGETPQVLKQEYQWTVPAAVTKANGLMNYDYTFVHQAGAHPTLTVTIYGPNGAKLAAGTLPSTSTPVLGAPPAPVLTPVDQGGLQYGGKDGAPLTEDVTFVVNYKA